MFLPYNVDVPMARIPWANWGLIGVTSLVSMAILLDWWPQDRPRLPENADIHTILAQLEKDLKQPPPLALRPSNFSFPQLFTHLLVHGDFVHLLGNMFFLFVFGNAVNAKLGHGVFLLCYFLLGGVEGFAWLTFGNRLPMVGASGAICGLVGIFLVFFPRNEVFVLYNFYYYVGTFAIASFWIVLSYMAWDLLGTLFFGAGDIAYVCHLAGECTGIALGIGLALNGFKPAKYEENLLQVLGFQNDGRSRDNIVRPTKKRRR